VVVARWCGSITIAHRVQHLGSDWRFAIDKQSAGKFHYILEIFGRAATGLTILLGFLVVIPLTLWFAWVGRSGIAYSIAQSVFCLSFAWGLISLFQLRRSLRKLGLGPEGRTRLFSMKSRPDDPDELRAWRCGWQFMYAVLAVLLSMAAIPVASWLTGR
jgi:hypothetical protein